jgi:hypothetical protein
MVSTALALREESAVAKPAVLLSRAEVLTRQTRSAIEGASTSSSTPRESSIASSAIFSVPSIGRTISCAVRKSGNRCVLVEAFQVCP